MRGCAMQIGAVLSPGRLEGHGVDGVGLLDAEAVIDVDDRAVAGGGAIVTAIIGPHHMDAGGMKIAHRHVRALFPGLVAHQNALSFRSAGTGDGDAGLLEKRHSQPAPARIGLACFLHPPRRVFDQEPIKHERLARGRLARGRLVLHDRIDQKPDRLGAIVNDHARSDQGFALKHAAVVEMEAKLASIDIEATLRRLRRIGRQKARRRGECND